MASYIRELEREGSLPPLRPGSASYTRERTVVFEDERLDRHGRARSPVAGLYTRSDSPLIQPRPPSPNGRKSVQDVSAQNWLLIGFSLHAKVGGNTCTNMSWPLFTLP